METYKLQKGDEQFVYFMEHDDHESYALCIYEGRNLNGGYVFRSWLYGWKYIVNKEKTKVTWVDRKETKEFAISTHNGWLRYFPN